MHNARRLIVATVAVVVAWANIAAAQVLKQVPADTLMLVKLTNARQVSDKVAKLSETLGIAQFQPQMKDPLGFAKEQLGVTQGIKEDGDVVLAFLDPAAIGQRGDESILVLIPVTDYQQFVGNFQGAQQDGEVTEARITGETSFIAQWGDYAAISPSKDVVSKRPEAAISVRGLAVQELERKDVVFYANMEKLRTTVIPALQESRPQFLEELERNMNADPQQAIYIPVAKAAAEQGLNALEGFFRDAQGATIGLNLDEGGISTSAMAEFSDGTYAAQKIEALKPAGDQIVRGLPMGDYLLFGGTALNGQVLIGVINDFADPVLAELNKIEAPEAAKVRTFIDAFKTFIASSTSQTSGLLATNGQLGQDPIFKQVQITRGDANKLAEAQAAMLQGSNEMMNVFPAQGAKMNFTVAEKAKTVDGIAFDMVTATFEATDQSPEAMQAQQAMAWIYGAGGFTGYNAVVGDAQVGTVGFSEDELSNVVAAVKANDAAVVNQPHVQAVAKALPKQRIAEFYIPVDNWVKAGTHYATQFGMPIQLQLPPDLPPIGVSIATDGTAIRADSYVPTDLVQSLIAAGMQAFLAAQGGGGGAGL